MSKNLPINENFQCSCVLLRGLDSRTLFSIVCLACIFTCSLYGIRFFVISNDTDTQPTCSLSSLNDTPSLVNHCCELDVVSNFVFMTIKSSGRYHAVRLKYLLGTWVALALRLWSSGDQDMIVSGVEIITDTAVPLSWRRKKAVFIDASFCGSSHAGASLSCKFQEELRSYYRNWRSSKKPRWYCHFDDDIYVNVPNLLAALKRLGDPILTPLYVGKAPATDPRGRNVTWGLFGPQTARTVHWLTGQAVCLSQKLMRMMQNVVENDTHPYNFRQIGIRTDDADDTLLAMFITEHLGIPLTEIEEIYTSYDYDIVLSLNEAQVHQAITLPHIGLNMVQAAKRKLSRRSNHSINSPDSTADHEVDMNYNPVEPLRFVQLHRRLLAGKKLSACR